MKARSSPVLAVILAGLAVAACCAAASSDPPGSRPATGPIAGNVASSQAAPNDRPCFMLDVMPMIDRLGCAAVECHGSSAGRGMMRLSLFGAYPAEDYAAIVKSAGQRRVNRVEPLKSLLLLKLTGALPHKGGAKITPNSRDYDVLVKWLAAGAPFEDPKAARTVSIEISPPRHTLTKDQTARFTVTAVLSDGSRKDVTADAVFRSQSPAVAQPAAGGAVKGQDFGQAAIIATYLRHSGVAWAIVPQKPPEKWPEFPPANKIDELAMAKWKELGIVPSELSTDQEFIRRVFLDVIGLLPKPDEARAFLADADAAKRSKLIDKLLERDEYADYWALMWGDILRIKSEYPINLWPNAVQAYHQWVREGIARNKPYDQFARELLTAAGSNFRDGRANYYRAVAKKDPQSLSEATALVFMGARMGCARCHGHPTESWLPDDTLGMAAFFAQVQYKATQEWKEEIVYLNPELTLKHPATKNVVAPKFLDGPSPRLPAGADARAEFARWLTDPQNPWLARCAVNRVWYWLMGRGIVHEVDDLRPTNPPANPELLAYLEGELVAGKFDLKRIYRLILNSRTYQLSSRTNASNAGDLSQFSHYRARRLTAEQLLDAIGQLTETSEPFSSRIPEPYTVMPEGFGAIQLPDGSIGTPFLELFGRPPRDTPLEGERDAQASMQQAMHLMNSAHIEGKITKSPRLARLLKDAGDADIIDELYLSALSRLPSEQEKQKLTRYIAGKGKARNLAIQDLVWALLNTKEFLFNH